MAQAKSRGARAAKKPAAAKSATAVASATQAKPARRRIPRRKQVEQHILSYFEAIGRRDSYAMSNHWSEDAVADVVPLGILRGRTEIVGLFRDLFAAVPDLQTTVTRVVAGERQAAVEWRMDGHFTGRSFQGVEPTGRWVELRGVDLIEVAEGKNSSAAAYYDGMSFARQIGLMPAQDSGSERVMKSALNAATKLRRTFAARRGGR